MLAVLLSALPLIGLIYLCVVSFGGSASASRRNWARAVLVWQVIAIVLSVILYAIDRRQLLDDFHRNFGFDIDQCEGHIPP